MAMQVRISCAGFPTKMAYEDFVDHFWNLVPQLLDRADLSDAEIARAIVKQADLQGHQAGKTKVLTPPLPWVSSPCPATCNATGLFLYIICVKSTHDLYTTHTGEGG